MPVRRGAHAEQEGLKPMRQTRWGSEVKTSIAAPSRRARPLQESRSLRGQLRWDQDIGRAIFDPRVFVAAGRGAGVN